MMTGPFVQAETVFEGFYRIERAKKHIGFGVQRLRKDGDKRILTSYYRMKQSDGSEVFDSYKTVANARGEPISSEHQGNRGFGPNLFASFKGGAGQVRYGSWQKPPARMVKGIDLFSTMLLWRGNLPKLALGKAYQYHAFAEEFGRNGLGTLHVVDTQDVSGLKISHYVDDFVGEPMEAFVSHSGQPLGSRTIAGDVYAFWVRTRAEAIDVFTYPNQDVVKIFGDLPVGDKNEFAAVEGLNAEQIMRQVPAWKGKRVLTSVVLAKTPKLPTRAL